MTCSTSILRHRRFRLLVYLVTRQTADTPLLRLVNSVVLHDRPLDLMMVSIPNGDNAGAVKCSNYIESINAKYGIVDNEQSPEVSGMGPIGMGSDQEIGRIAWDGQQKCYIVIALEKTPFFEAYEIKLSQGELEIMAISSSDSHSFRTFIHKALQSDLAESAAIRLKCYLFQEHQTLLFTAGFVNGCFNYSSSNFISEVPVCESHETISFDPYNSLGTDVLAPITEDEGSGSNSEASPPSLTCHEDATPDSEEVIFKTLQETMITDSLLMDGPVTVTELYILKNIYFLVIGLGCGVAALLRTDNLCMDCASDEEVYNKVREDISPIILPGANMHGSVQAIVVADVNESGFDEIVRPFF